MYSLKMFPAVINYPVYERELLVLKIGGTICRRLSNGDHEIRWQHPGNLPDNVKIQPVPDVVDPMFGNPTAAFILLSMLSLPLGRPPAVLRAITQVTTAKFTLALGNWSLEQLHSKFLRRWPQLQTVLAKVALLGYLEQNCSSFHCICKWCNLRRGFSSCDLWDSGSQGIIKSKTTYPGLFGGQSLQALSGRCDLSDSCPKYIQCPQDCVHTI